MCQIILDCDILIIGESMNNDNRNKIILLCVIGVAIVIFFFLNMSAKKDVRKKKAERQNEITESIEDPTIKRLYSYVYNTHFFLSLDEATNDITTPTEKLFTDFRITSGALSSSYRMSMAYATLGDQDEQVVSKSDLTKAYHNIFGTDDVDVKFDCYNKRRVGLVRLRGTNYVFSGSTIDMDMPMGEGYVLVNVKKEDDVIELYEATYRDNLLDLSSSLDQDTYDYYGKDNKKIFSLKSKDVFDNPSIVDENVVKYADQFEQHMITYTKGSDGGYYLTSVEPVE